MIGVPARVAARRARAGAIVFLGLAVCVLWAKPMGLLLWARIRILTNIPRTAIADEVLEQALVDAARSPSRPPVSRIELPARTSRDPFAPSNPPSPHGSTSESPAVHAGEAKSAADSAE